MADTTLVINGPDGRWYLRWRQLPIWTPSTG